MSLAIFLRSRGLRQVARTIYLTRWSMRGECAEYIFDDSICDLYNEYQCLYFNDVYILTSPLFFNNSTVRNCKGENLRGNSRTFASSISCRTSVDAS